MNKKVYVLTNDETHSILGVFSSWRKASIVLCKYAKGLMIDYVKPSYVGVQYYYIHPETGELTRYFIEEVEMNDHYMLTDDPKEE